MRYCLTDFGDDYTVNEKSFVVQNPCEFCDLVSIKHDNFPCILIEFSELHKFLFSYIYDVHNSYIVKIIMIALILCK